MKRPITIVIDRPRSIVEAIARISEAAGRHETWVCAALAAGTVVEIWIGVVRSIAP